MRKNSLSDLFISTAGKLLFVIVTLNVIGLIFDLLRLDNFDNYNLKFQHGYFILNDEQIGINVFANLFSFIILTIIFTTYIAKGQTNTENRLD